MARDKTSRKRGSSEEPLSAPELVTSRQLSSRGAKLPRVYGYTFDGDEILFRYELSEDTNLVTDSQSGERSRFKAADKIEVSVAGDFSDWAPKTMQPDAADPQTFELRVPRSQLGNDVAQFKFLINGRYWVNPPWFARNTVPAESTPEARNLVVSGSQANPDPLRAPFGFVGGSADGDLQSALGVTIALINSAAHGIYARSWETIDPRAAATLRALLAADGHASEEVGGINVLTIVSGRVSREIVVAHLPTGTLGQSWTDYVLEGERLIGRLKTQLG
jgi:hypothetical protein